MKFLTNMAALLCIAFSTTFLQAQTTSTAKPKTTNTANAALAKSPKASPQAEVPGGGAGKVWVNTDSNVYHCPGTRYYGKTKAGKYMTEAQAKAAGAKVAKGQNCSK